jgi:DNA invertase Pin-like site-specific DNA recombinase
MRVAEQRGWNIVEVYEDHGVGGGKARDKRPGFHRLSTDAAKGRINMVAAWALDRLPHVPGGGSGIRRPGRWVHFELGHVIWND